MRLDNRDEGVRSNHFDQRERQELAARQYHNGPTSPACDAARDDAIKKANALEHALSGYGQTGIASPITQILPCLELVRAGGIPLGLPPLQVEGPDSLELAGIRRAYHEFCVALRELQIAGQGVCNRES